MQNLYIIDAAGYAYRSYFAIRNMTNAKGESTNSLFGFVRSVLKLIKDFQVEYCIAVFDGKNNALARTAIYPEYKATRQAMPPDLLHQIQWAKEFCKLIGISILDHEGVEADDTVGSIAKWAKKQGVVSYICSTDKDLCQLVSDKIFLIDTYKENQIIGEKEVLEKFKVPPSLIVDYLSLMGDASDNVPGVPGIGPKTAADLLNTHGSLDALLEHPESISGKKKELFIQHKDHALISRKLVTLNTDVDFPKDPEFFRVKPQNSDELKAFYTHMQFHTLIKEMALKDVSEKENNCSYIVIDDEEALKSLIQELSSKKSICIDTETTSIHSMLAELVGIGLGVEPEKAWYIPLNGKIGREKVLLLLKPFLADPNIGFFGHNLKYDLHVLQNAGIPISNIIFDTLLASYLLNTHSRRHSLDELSLEHFGFVKTEIASLIGKGKNQITMNEVPIEKVAAYACEDIDYTIRLKELFLPQIEQRGFTKLYYELELPLLNVLFEMEQKGIFLDVENLSRLREYLAAELAKLTAEIYQLSGEEFNLNSPLQLSKILFEKLKIRAPKGTSTSAEVLEELKWEHPIAGKIQEYRILEKLRSTYVETLPLEVNPKTNRIHCNFNQSVAATGRLSCQDPNLQNIPVRSEAGLRVREAFRPEKKGWSFIAADYSQIELRLLAHLSQDPVLLSAFQKGKTSMPIQLL